MPMSATSWSSPAALIFSFPKPSSHSGMHTRKRLDAESYEAAFLFSHFISSCYAEADEEYSTSSSGGSWQLHTVLDRMHGTNRHCMSWLRTRSVDQGISDALDWERCSALPELSMNAIKAFARSKKAEHHKTNLPKSGDWQKDILEDTGLANVYPDGIRSPDMPGSFSGPGFICAYCNAKLRERRLLIKHLLRDHGTATNMDLGLKSKPHIVIHNSNK